MWVRGGHVPACSAARGPHEGGESQVDVDNPLRLLPIGQVSQVRNLTIDPRES